MGNVKVRHLQYKVRDLQYKVRQVQVFAGTALYLYLPENILQTPEFFGQITAFLCRAYICLLRQVMAVLNR
ncbi:hypothetical protein [Microcoleus sp. LAD1_D3]|uniref:hypothetical protein n=1 Tax=Microcoleus sp. LAD1_D3 TaxID=2819365 RepID=UPI002FD720F2